MRFSTVGSPVPFSDLIGNKLVGSFGIWHPQERLSQREERHSFGTAHAIFLEELVNPAFLLRGPQSSQQAESLLNDTRSEERRVGKACGGTCSSRWSPSH